MLCLRIARGYRPGALLRRLLVVAASAGASFLLLAALGHALGHPGEPAASTARLVWCVVPLAAVIQLCVALVRVEPSGGFFVGLAAAGLGPTRLPLLVAGGTALACSGGSLFALVAFLYLRGDLPIDPFTAPESVPAIAPALAADQPLPLPAALTLLAVVPLVSAAACAAALRPPRSAKRGPDQGPAGSVPGPAAASGYVPPALPWGATIAAAGLTFEVYASRWREQWPSSGLALPGGLAPVSPAVLGGWALTAAGLVLAGPGLVHGCGRLLSAAGPGALRLLAGRGLQVQARRLGHPLGVLCATVTAALAVVRLWGDAHTRGPGPLSMLGAAVVACCVGAAVLATAAGARAGRRGVLDLLVRLGTSGSFLRRAVALRILVLVAVLLPTTWLLAELAALPLRG